LLLIHSGYAILPFFDVLFISGAVHLIGNILSKIFALTKVLCNGDFVCIDKCCHDVDFQIGPLAYSDSLNIVPFLRQYHICQLQPFCPTDDPLFLSPCSALLAAFLASFVIPVVGGAESIPSPSFKLDVSAAAVFGVETLTSTVGGEGKEDLSAAVG
jgi:hypothetical protein